MPAQIDTPDIKLQESGLPIDKMPMVRVFFSKKGRAKYTSHLDTMRTMTRAFRRSGLPVWYTQGFNPHIYMTFALPIALGYESECESVDIRLTRQTDFSEVTECLNKALPPGFSVVKAQSPSQDPQAIAWADYDIRLIYTETDARLIGQKLNTFLALPVIEVSKKTKKGEKLIDIKPLCEVLSAKIEEDVITLKLRTASGNTLNINPTLFLKEFYKWSRAEPDGVKILRTAILHAEKQDFE